MKQFLIIDDNEYDRYFLKECLNLLDEGIDIKEAYTIESGINKLKETTFDAVFLDYNLSGETAYEYFKVLESEKMTPPLTVIMSGVDMGKNVRPLMEKGAVDYLLKDNITTKNLEIILSKSEVSFNKLKSLGFFQGIVENYSDITILCDLSDKVLYLNDKAKDVIPETLIGKPYSSFIKKSSARHWLIEGRETPYELIKSPVLIKGDHFKCIVLKNASKLASLQQSLDQSDKFSKALSHDLRDQLGACDAIAQLINADPKSNQMEDNLKLMANSLKAAVKIIDSLAIITGQKKTSVEGFIDLADILRFIKEDLYVDMPEIEADFNCSRVYGNSKLLITVFQNMLVNSFKHYHGPSSSKVKITARDEGDKVIVDYTDNGPGIPKDITSSLCKFGIKGESSHGMGLGMYLVKSALDIMSGELKALKGQKGAHFQIILRKVTPQ